MHFFHGIFQSIARHDTVQQAEPFGFPCADHAPINTILCVAVRPVAVVRAGRRRSHFP